MALSRVRATLHVSHDVRPRLHPQAILCWRLLRMLVSKNQTPSSLAVGIALVLLAVAAVLAVVLDRSLASAAALLGSYAVVLRALARPQKTGPPKALAPRSAQPDPSRLPPRRKRKQSTRRTRQR